MKRAPATVVLVLPAALAALGAGASPAATPAAESAGDAGLTLSEHRVVGEFENWSLPGETMGMARFGLRRSFSERLSLGIDSFAAVDGARGGFITLGFGAEYQWPLTERLSLEVGVAVGAGGGRSGRSIAGGGLFFRESLGLAYDVGRNGELALGVSHVEFPDGGTIEGEQLYAGYRHRFDAVSRPLGAARRPASEAELAAHPFRAHEFVLVARQIEPDAGSRRAGGGVPQRDFGTIGAEWRSSVSEHGFLRVEAAGAMSGDSPGYMHILWGGGLRWPLSPRVSALAMASIGAAGGGFVETGGGLLLDAGVGLQWRPGSRVAIEAMASRYAAPDGDLDATSYALRAAYLIGPRERGTARGAAGEVAGREAWPLRIRAVVQQYRGSVPDWRDIPERDVGLLGAQVDYLLGNGLYLTGQGIAAYSGDAAAYMIGLVGAGYQREFGAGVVLKGEALLGAAGGGGLAVGPGLVAQVNLGAGYRFDGGLELMATVGRIGALSGPMRADVYGLALGYRFEAITARD
jgi:hypothetical protein